MNAQAQSFDDYMAEAQSAADMWDYDEAIAAYDKALKLQPENTEIYFLRGYAKDMYGDRESAVDDYDKAIELHPEDSRIYHARGYAREYIYEYKGAVEDFTKFLELEGDPYVSR